MKFKTMIELLDYVDPKCRFYDHEYYKNSKYYEHDYVLDEDRYEMDYIDPDFGWQQ